MRSSGSPLIRPEMLVGEVLKQHPEARRLFSKYRLEGGDYGSSIEQFARRAGVDPRSLLDELNHAVDDYLRIRLEQEG